MENTPRRRTPRPRLKVPILGDLGGIGSGSFGGGQASADPNAINKFLSRITPLLVLGFGAWMFFNTSKSFTGGGASTGIYDPDEIKEVSWDNLKITKKYPTDSKQLVLELRGKNFKQTYNLTKEKNQVWEYVMPYDYLTKTANSLEVKVKNFSGKDTTLVMKFDE